MKVLHQIGDRAKGGNFNSLEEILAYDGPISFDGVYMSVYENYRALVGKDVTFFFSGKYLGGDNSFDVGQPLSKFCNMSQIMEMADYLGARIGYHGWAHLRCTELTPHDLIKEISPNLSGAIDILQWKGMILAWPYGDVNEACACTAAALGYKEAWSVYPKDDDSSPFMKNRTSLNWDMYDAKGNNLGIQP